MTSLWAQLALALALVIGCVLPPAGVHAVESIPLTGLVVFELLSGAPPNTWLDVSTSRLANYNAECFPMFSEAPFVPSCSFGSDGQPVAINITETHNLAFAALFDKNYYEDASAPSIPQIAFDLNLTRCRVDHRGGCDFETPVTATTSAFLMNEMQMMLLGAPAGVAGILYLLHTTTPKLQEALTTLSGEAWSGLRITPANAEQFLVAKHHPLIGNDTGPIFAPFFEFAVYSSSSSDLSTGTIVAIVFGATALIVILCVLIINAPAIIRRMRKPYENVDMTSHMP